MPTNPLDNPGDVFDLCLMNPNPSAGKNKQGSWYRVSFELTQEDHQLFMDADTKGMVIAAKACVVDNGEGEELEKTAKKQKGPYSDEAKKLWLSSFLRTPQVWRAIGTDQQYLDWLKTQTKCPVDDEKYGPHEGDIIPMHVRRVKAGDDRTGSGVASKPEYSAIPGCAKHHAMQHAMGESGVGGREFYDKSRIRYLQRWAWERMTAKLGAESMSDVAPIQVFKWATSLSIENYLPLEYRLAEFRTDGS